MAVTITDVAKLAGVSPSTVSRTCKDHPSISPATKAKVRKAMATLGYEQAVVNTARKIGVIFPKAGASTYENPFYLEAVRGIGKYCNEQGYTVLVLTGEDDEELLHSIRTAQADGFIFLYSDVNDKIIDYMYAENLLFVLIGKATQKINDTIYVDNDNVQAARESCEYLIRLGHRHIAYIGTDDNRIVSNDRKAGYLLALSEHNLPYRKDYCLALPSAIGADYQQLAVLLTGPERPTALIVCDDLLATAIAPTIFDTGLRIPSDISIISFNNSIFARMMNPPLTSIDINSYQLGREAAIQLAKHIASPQLVATKTIVPFHIVERKSCAPWIK